MRLIRLSTETDYDGWRAAARALRVAGVNPRQVAWTVKGSEVDKAFPQNRPSGEAPPAPVGSFAVPRAFGELAAEVMLHRWPERFALLYRLLWRLEREPRLMTDRRDPDLMQARRLAEAVRAAAARMVDEVRLRPVAGAQGVSIGWHAPAHRVAALAGPALAARFAGQAFTVLTPEASLHWDTRALAFGPGAPLGADPPAAALDDFWRRRCASHFHAPTPPVVSSRDMKAALRASRDAPWDHPGPETLGQVLGGIAACRRCDLWRGACQGVGGEGPAGAAVMLVGDQPGDADDQAGRPFVGPAGALLDRALAEAGLNRADVYLTNAVRHFKHRLEGERRAPRGPTGREVDACRLWLDAERRLVRPRVVVALGGAAALAVFGRPMPVVSSRGRLHRLGQGAGVVSFHPAFVLGLPDERARTESFHALAGDLRLAR
ncbi:UdgX family uracil-DNA binding protein [Caulobacter sp. KR2-114]|uniref:UdgX family uracil-DNA binding protein n=1 Tax=Caulobacter sp. KR2-114 TaxID=3400912 RepID=UPI003C08ED82